MVSFILLFGGAALCFTVLVALYLSLYLGFFLLGREMKRVDPETWKRLGFFAGNHFSAEIREEAFAEFYTKNGYGRYGNRRISFLARAMTVIPRVTNWLWIAFVVLLIGFALR